MHKGIMIPLFRLKRGRKRLYFAFSVVVVLGMNFSSKKREIKYNIHDEKNQEPSKKITNQTSFVLLNAYMRSGSTFLGRLLGYRRNAFYIYEPLRNLYKYSYHKGNILCETRTLSCRNSTSSLKASISYISDLFHCNLSQHADKFSELLVRKSGPKWKIYLECAEGSHSSNELCLRILEKNCQIQNIRIQKVLRISLQDAELLLEAHQNLKIIHIFRDPRAIINSHIYTFWFPTSLNDTGKIIKEAQSLCFRIENDIIAAKSLIQLFPGRIRIVHYEDIILNPWKTRYLVDFVNTKDIIESYNRSLQTNNLNKKQENGISKDFSKAFKYRMTLPFKLVKSIQSHCADVIKKLGLNLYETVEELHNFTFGSSFPRFTFEIN